MKKSSTLLYLCIVVSLLNILAMGFYARHDKTTYAPAPSGSQAKVSPMYSDIFMPQAMDFAGEAVPLQRLDVREALKKELIVNAYLHSHTIQILETAPRMFAILEPILKARNIPDDFKYLAVIESRLDPQIVSPSGAVGIWQIMKETGRELKLEVNQQVDERYHIEKSTEAAATYLQKAYERFGSWTLAAASYNAAIRFLTKQMDIQKENNYYNLLLGEETERYVYRILALKQIMTHPWKYNFHIRYSAPSEPIEKVEVSTSVKSWADFAQQQGISYKTLKQFNPWLRKPELHNARHKVYQIDIPKNKKLYK